jgi:hypothetical protein
VPFIFLILENNDSRMASPSFCLAIVSSTHASIKSSIGLSSNFPQCN